LLGTTPANKTTTTETKVEKETTAVDKSEKTDTGNI
jgi:hypothetical protein